jgi:hypothetical protein
MFDPGAFAFMIFPILYVVICVALLFGVFRAFRNLAKLVELQIEANDLSRELIDEFRAKKSV